MSSSQSEHIITEVDGVIKTFTRMVFRESFTDVSPTTKLCILVYLIGLLLNNCYSIYNEGVKVLIKYRENHHLTTDSEWDVIRIACLNCAIWYFLESLIWPVTLISHIMPSVILYMNPQVQNKESKRK